MTTLQRLLTLGLLLAGVVSTARAQVCSPESPLRRTLPVNVLDQQGNLVRGLTAADFRASFRGQPARILSAEWDTSPRRIAILITGHKDFGENKRTVSEILAQEIEQSAPKDALVLRFRELSYSEDEIPPEEEAPEGESIAVDSPGGPLLLNALLEVARRLGNARPGDIIVLITDYRGDAAWSPIRQQEEALARLGVRLMLIQFRSELDRDLAFRVHVWGRPPSFKVELTELARATGGSVLPVDTTSPWWVDPKFTEEELAALRNRTRQLFAQMEQFYRLEVELPREAENLRDWKLRVVGGAGKRPKDVEVVYPRQLVPCTSSDPSH